MKKLFRIIFIISFIIVGEDLAIAGSIGNPGASLKKGNGSFDLEFSGVSREIRDSEGERYDTESWRLFLKGAYGITEKLEVFGRIGGATLKIRSTPFDSNPGIGAGAGLKGIFLDPPGHPLRYSLGGQVLYFQAEDGGAKARWFEYDIWAGITYKDLKDFVPYGGIIYSRVDGKLKDFPARPMFDKFESSSAAGIFLGLDWPLNQKTTLGLEWRGVGENSATLSLRLRF